MVDHMVEDHMTNQIVAQNRAIQFVQNTHSVIDRVRALLSGFAYVSTGKPD